MTAFGAKRTFCRPEWNDRFGAKRTLIPPARQALTNCRNDRAWALVATASPALKNPVWRYHLLY
jgi:hypothetical protein